MPSARSIMLRLTKDNKMLDYDESVVFTDYNITHADDWGYTIGLSGDGNIVIQYFNWNEETNKRENYGDPYYISTLVAKDVFKAGLKLYD